MSQFKIHDIVRHKKTNSLHYILEFLEKEIYVGNYNSHHYYYNRQVEKIDWFNTPLTFFGRDLTIGADPEVFVRSKTYGQIVPAYLTGITGTKDNPQPLPSGGAVQIDGCALEFNIKPVRTFSEFNIEIKNALKDIEELIPNDFELVLDRCVHEFDKTLFDEQPDEHKELGCDPDYNASSGQVNIIDRTNISPYFRTTGGHIHLGYTKNMDIEDPKFVYDNRHIVYSINTKFGPLFHNTAQEKTRMDLYGRGACFRNKSYGVEYRSPSNLWLSDMKKRKNLWGSLMLLNTLPIRSGLII